MSRGISQNSINRLAALFVCPVCRHSLAEQSAGSGDGVLLCSACNTAVPVVEGFACFGEASFLAGKADVAALVQRHRDAMGDPEAYSRFVDQAPRRPAFEPYAAFAPFNEATRALYPLIETLRRHLAPGDLVVDAWCRTGWTGALLAGLFPEQQVVSLWEGPSGVLGYAGYRYWLAESARPANWTVAFADPRRGLPFGDRMVALLHGADSLHRFELEPFLNECFRVVRDEAALVFPHVHLANSDPVPFFERGGSIRHGRDYRRFFDRTLDHGIRASFVLSERGLFARQVSRALVDEFETQDYNALIVVLANRHAPFAAGVPSPELAETNHLIPNPLISVDFPQCRAVFDPAAMAGRADYLLKRHPVYAERLAQRLPAQLDGNDLRVLYWARLAPELTLAELRQRVALRPADFAAATDRLESHEVAHSAPSAGAMSSLQSFFATRRKPVALCDQHFAGLWREAAKHYAGRTLIQSEDGSAFTVGETEEILSHLAAVLRANGIGPGRALVVLSAANVEAVLAIWAAWLLGAVVVPLDPLMPGAQLRDTIARVNPPLVLAQAGILPAVPRGCASFRLGTEADQTVGAARSLVEEMADHPAIDNASLPAPEEDSHAAILFTSGSTGRPKGVVLSQGAIWRSARAIVEGLGWSEDDTLLSLGGLHTMSGLRNPCVAALAAGATIVLPDPRRAGHPATLAEACRRWQVTLLAGVPALIANVAAASVPARLRFAPLRQVAVAGSMLGEALREAGERAFAAPVQAYYGLTETGGVCLLVPPGSVRQGDGDIGTPAGAFVRIVDEDSAPVGDGKAGELQIYSGNLTLGYLGDEARTATLFDRGWLRTGDLAKWGADGHVILLGRRDDQIKSRHGEIVHPAAIEAALAGRRDVAEAAVIGVGEGADIRIVAFVVPRESGGTTWLAELRTWALRALGPGQAPDRFFEKQTLPRLSSGKVARRMLRDEVLAS